MGHAPRLSLPGQWDIPKDQDVNIVSVKYSDPVVREPGMESHPGLPLRLSDLGKFLGLRFLRFHYVHSTFKVNIMFWLMWLSGVSAGLQTKRSPV